MILSDKAIMDALDHSDIEVDPKPTPQQIQPASLDVRLGGVLYNCDSDVYAKSVNDHVLHPDTRYLGYTKESITLPNDVAAQLTGRSTIGRLGIIVHKTAGWIDPSFEGQITLELYNLGNEPVRLDVGQRVAQLVFFQLDQSSSGYSGKYQEQQGITEAIADD